MKNQNQLIADQIDAMEGLTADDLNHLAAELEEIE